MIYKLKNTSVKNLTLFLLMQKYTTKNLPQKNSNKKNNIPKAKAPRKGIEQAFAKIKQAVTTRKATQTSKAVQKILGEKTI